MICKDCDIRFAPLPKEDWEFVPFYDKTRINGFYPKHKDSEKKRLEVFNSNEVGSCGCILDS